MAAYSLTHVLIALHLVLNTKAAAASTAAAYQGLACATFARPSACTMWKTGKYPWSELGSRSPETKLKSCGSIDLHGNFFSGRWKPTLEKCEYAWLQPADAYNCLKGKRVLVAGDSMLRQVFHRFVGFFRHQSVLGDYKHHGDAFYVVNGTHDHYHQVDMRNMRGARNFLDPSLQPLKNEVVFTFLWAPKEFRVEDTRQLKPYAIIAGPMYHIADIAQSTHDQIATVLTSMDDSSSFVWVTTPLRNESEAARHNFDRRNVFARGFVSGLRHMRPKSFVLGFDRLVRMSPWRPVDRHHFQCSMANLTDAMSHAQEDLDCRDMLNLNVVQLMLNALCTK